MPLLFTLKSVPEFSLDLSVITPDKLAGKSLTQIRGLQLICGNKRVTIGRLFAVKGRDSRHIVFCNGSTRFTHIGHNMMAGLIEVHGSVGHYVGQGIKGGRIVVYGDVGSWLGNQMSNGRIDVNGDAGDYVGASLPGDAFGMKNGLINIVGSAGDRVGDRMRRGLIVIQGKAGDYCASRVYAGTIIVLDRVRAYPGRGMRRGTLVLAKKPASMSATFKRCGRFKLPFLRLLFTQIMGIGDEFSMLARYGPEACRFVGDLSINGQGEILIL